MSIYIMYYIRFRPRGGSCVTVTTPLVFNPRAFAQRMFGRLLVVWLWCDFIARGNIQTGEACGTNLASWPSTEKATSEILPVQGSHRLLGEKDKKESETGVELIVRASLLQSNRIPFPSPESECHDVALSCMQGQQYTKDDLLSVLSCSLEHGMDSAATFQIQEHQEAEAAGFGIQGDRECQSGARYMGGISGKAALGLHNAGQQGPAQNGGRNFCGQASGDASAASSSTSAIGRSTNAAHSGRGQDVAASQRFAGHGHGAYRVNDKKIGGAFYEGGEGTIQSNTDSWTAEQAQQAQSAGCHRCTKDQGYGPRMVSLCQQYGGQNSSAWRDVPELQSRSYGALQRQDPRIGKCQKGDDFGFPDVVGTSVDGASHSRDAGLGTAARRLAEHHGDGGKHRPDRSDRSHGGRGGAFGDRGHAARCSNQSHSSSNASFSWVRFSKQSGHPSSQAESARIERQQGCQIQGEGERGQVIDKVAMRSNGVIGKFAPILEPCSRWLSLRQMFKDFWFSHFNQDFSWTRSMSATDGIMPYDEEEHMWNCPDHVPPQDEHFAYECEGYSDAHHNNINLTTVENHDVKEVEAKSRLPCFGDGSSDSLESMIGRNVEFGSDQGNLDLIMPADFQVAHKATLWDGMEANLDLLASQVPVCEINTYEPVTEHEKWRDMPSWCRYNLAVRDGKLNGRGRQINRKRVSFCSTIELQLEFQGKLFKVVISEREASNVWRHLWHLHGQIADWHSFQMVFARMANLNMVLSWSGDTAMAHNEEPPMPQHESGNQDGVSDAWWYDFTQGCSECDRRPEFIATWYLSPDRFHLCMRPRRIRFHRNMRLQDFESVCRDTWKELMDGSQLNMYVVRGRPEGLPSTKAHIIIVQGDTTPWSTLVMKGVGLPPLMSVRAVLVARDCSVRSVFSEAQYPDACDNRNFLCCVQYENFGEMIQLADGDQCRVPQAQYVVGNLCPLDISDGEEDGSVSDASTDLPSGDSEDDTVAWLSTSAQMAEPFWSWEAHSISKQDGPITRNDRMRKSLAWQEPSNEVTVEPFGSWQAPGRVRSRHAAAGGGEGNLDLTWLANHKPTSSFDSDETDEIGWMSNRPVNMQFERPDPYPWEFIEDDDLNQEEEEDIMDDVTFAQGHQEQSQAFIDQALEGLDESERRWVVVTFGLGLVDLGRRDTTFNPWRLHELEGKIRTLWEDHLRYGSLTIYHVTPQPHEVAGPNSLVVLVVIESPEDMNEDVRNVLVIQRGPRQLPLRPAPYGAKIFTDISTRDALVQLDMHKHCKPFRMRNCIMRLGHDVMLPDQRYEVENGLLCTVRVEDTPELVVQAGETIDRVEDFYLQVEELQHMEGKVHQVICHVHGISPANRPLGWRQLILEGDDLLHLEWIEQLQQLWPFDSRDARVVFCTMATDDLRDAENIRFHFIIDFGRQEGLPILVQQQIVSAQSMPYRSEGANEYWAITVMEGPVSQDIVSALAIHPFWFEYALEQRVQPHVLVNGRRVSGLQTDWQVGDFVHIRLQVWQNHHMLSILLHEGSEIQRENEVEHTSFLQVRLTKASKEGFGPFGEMCQAMCDSLLDQGDTSSDCVNSALVHDAYIQYDDPTVNEPLNDRDMDAIDELQQQLRFVMGRGFEGINHDFTWVPDLHPFASEACKITDTRPGNQPVYHIYTDGSSKNDMATWAITILQQSQVDGRCQFHRAGYAAGWVQDDLGSCDSSAMDAEATAIIAMAEFSLCLLHQKDCRIFCHFDAQAVGFGATGVSNIPERNGSQSVRQVQARTIMTILEQRSQQNKGYVQGCHVKAHQGQPWNEMADSIAKAVWKGWTPPVIFQFRSKHLLQHQLAAWAWLEVAPTDELPDLRTILKNERPEANQGQVDSTLEFTGGDVTQDPQKANLIFATVNVRTLDYGSGEGHNASWKVVELLRQFSDKGIHIIGVQESRSRASACVTMGPFVRLISAGKQGQAGVELWLNVEELGRIFGATIQAEKDLCAWHSDSRILAVRCSLGSVVFDIIVLYAPQQGREAWEVAAWWGELEAVMEKRDINVPVVCLGDFNARLGSITSAGCDDHAWDVEDEAGSRLRLFAERWGLLIPSTFAQYHDGPTATFISPLGHSSRIDFILISNESQAGISRSYVDDTIDVMNGDRDHRPLLLEVGLQWTPKRTNKFTRMSFYDREAAREWCKSDGTQLLTMLPEQPWLQDVNTHWANMRQHLQEGAAKFFPRKKRKPRQLYFNEHTWNLLCDRKELRQQHREIQRNINRCYLRHFFNAWKCKDETMGHSKLAEWDLVLLRQQEAVTLEARINIDVRFRRCKKADWKKWTMEQLDQKIQRADQAQCSDLFHILQPKKMIAKHAGKLTKPLPGYKSMDGTWKFSRCDIAEAWQHQFAGIENADTVTFSDLMEKSKPICEPRDAKQLLELPTLLDVEKALRQLNSAKAPGLDGLGAELFRGDCATAAKRIFPLVLKMGLRCQGAPELTGGWLLPLFKGKGSAQNMQGYRAILLEPVVARAISKAWRHCMVQGLNRVAQPMQWGGRSGLSIESLHLQVQMWQAQAKRQRLSHALIFIDIRSAFYSVVKEMLTGCTNDTKIKHVFQRMGLPFSAWQEFRANVGRENTLADATQSALTAGNTEAILQHTWFVVPDSQSIQAPATGSRPGDPGADVLFSFIMSRILERIHERAGQAGMPLHYQDDHTGMRVTRCVTWVDDLAVSVCASATQVVDKAIHMMSIIQDAMLEHGMVLTCGAGKTAAIFAFHGEGATKARQTFESTNGGHLCVMSEHVGCLKIPVVAHYKHLGGHITRTGSCLQEIKTRSASTLAKLHPLRKLLKNPKLGNEKRGFWLKALAFLCCLYTLGLGRTSRKENMMHGKQVFFVFISRFSPETSRAKCSISICMSWRMTWNHLCRWNLCTSSVWGCFSRSCRLQMGTC